jgi:hypothetical protein
MEQGQWVKTVRGTEVWVPDYKWWYLRVFAHCGWHTGLSELILPANATQLMDQAPN